MSTGSGHQGRPAAGPTDSGGAEVLAVRDLTAYLGGRTGLRRVLQRVSLRVRRGRTFALLGESGSGKTCLFHSLLGLHTGGPGVVSGEADLLGVKLFRALPAQDHPERWARGQCAPPVLEIRRNVKALLGTAVTLVPQDPLTALPPFFPVGELIGQALRMGPAKGRMPERAEVLGWLARVHMYGVEDVARRFVHELSGGMAQRVALALALAPGPQMVVADEPTTGLDATLRVNLLVLLRSAVEEHHLTLCLITHDMEAARLLARDVAVLCHGSVVEAGPAEVVLRPDVEPKHPYTAFLLSAERQLISGVGTGDRSVGAGTSTDAQEDGGCPYLSRCPRAKASCGDADPQMTRVGPDHWIACHEGER